MANGTDGACAGKPRRGFLKVVGSLASGIITALAGWKSVRLSARAASSPLSPGVVPEAPGNELIRMQQDLEEALARPVAARSWAMVVDTRKCVGCQACVVACRAENMTGPAGSYRRVIQVPFGLGRQVTAVFKPANCLQCGNPPCAQAVPDGMIRRRPDGIVEFDYGKLKGPYAQVVAAGCPYKAVHVDDGKRFTTETPAPQAYEKRTFQENGQTWSRADGTPLAGVARKCTFCSHLLDAGILPACVTTCVGGAMYFGDANSRTSLVNQLLRERRVIQMHEDAGVKPRVFYVDEPLPQVQQTHCAACHY